jgi:beta-lactamase class A
MDYGRLGERQRRMRLPILALGSAALLLVAIVLSMFQLVDYSNTRDSLATDLTVAGVAVGGLSEPEAQARWEQVYLEQPVWLYLEDNLILLDPVSDAGFQLDSDAMLDEARARSRQETNFWSGFWNYLWQRPVSAVSVPLKVDYDDKGRDQLRAFLEESLAGYFYNEQSSQASFDLASYQFTPGAPGKRLDVDRAMVLIEEALREPEPENRQVELPVIESEPQQTIDMNMLRQALEQLIGERGFDGSLNGSVASVYILDLQSGDEVAIRADVPHSAVSTIKIPIMVNLFRQKLLLTSDPQAAYLLTESVLCSNNSSSNFLMQLSGVGNDFESALRDGLNQVSCTAQALGAEHTYISAPLYVADRAYEFEAAVCRPETPANTSFATEPDPFMQTTAADMGMLLTLIYDCATYGSGLMAAYPDDITQLECQQMIEVMSGNRIDRLIELGVPLGTRIAHKNGWGPVTSADAGIVFSPGGDYILSVYVYEPDTDSNNLPTLASWELIEVISYLTYKYFNPDTEYQLREPLNPFGAVDCVTVMDPEDVNLNDVDQNRVDADGNPLPSACYGGAGNCRPFDNWGQDN